MQPLKNACVLQKLFCGGGLLQNGFTTNWGDPTLGETPPFTAFTIQKNVKREVKLTHFAGNVQGGCCVMEESFKQAVW